MEKLTEKPNTSSRPQPWTAEMDVKLLLAYIDSVSKQGKPEWADIAAVMNKTEEGVRQRMSKLRRRTNAQANGTAGGTTSDQIAGNKKATTTGKKRVKVESDGDSDDVKVEEQPKKKGGRKPKAPKIEAEE